MPSRNGRARPRASRQSPWASVKARCGTTAATQPGGRAGSTRRGSRRSAPSAAGARAGRGRSWPRPRGGSGSAGVKTHDVARPAEPEGEVDVLVVGAEGRVEGADPAQGRGAVEGARPAGAEDAVGRVVAPAARRLAVARACWASRRARRSRRPNRPGSGSERTRTSGATEPTVGSANGARPASIQPAVTSVSLFRSWMNSPRAAAIPALAAAQKPPFRSSRTSADVGMRGGEPGGGVVGRGVVGDDDLDRRRRAGRCRAMLARQVSSSARPL